MKSLWMCYLRWPVVVVYGFAVLIAAGPCFLRVPNKGSRASAAVSTFALGMLLILPLVADLYFVVRLVVARIAESRSGIPMDSVGRIGAAALAALLRRAGPRRSILSAWDSF